MAEKTTASILHDMQHICPTLVTLLRGENIILRELFGDVDGVDGDIDVSNFDHSSIGVSAKTSETTQKDVNEFYWRKVQLMFVLRILIVRSSHLLGQCILSSTDQNKKGNEKDCNKNDCFEELFCHEQLQEKLALFHNLLSLVEPSLNIDPGHYTCDQGDIHVPSHERHERKGRHPQMNHNREQSHVLFVQACQAYNFTPEEQRVLQWIVLVKTSPSTSILYTLLPHSLADNILGIVGQIQRDIDPCHIDIIQFICNLTKIQWSIMSQKKESASSWRNDGIIEFRSSVLDEEQVIAHVPNEVCRLLRGGFASAITDEERLKLSDTLLLYIFETSFDFDSKNNKESGIEGTDASIDLVDGKTTDINRIETKARVHHNALLNDVNVESKEQPRCNGEEQTEKDDRPLLEEKDGPYFKLLQTLGTSDECQDQASADGSHEVGLPQTPVIDQDEPHCYTCELDYLNDQFALVMYQIHSANQRLEQDLKDVPGVAQMAKNHDKKFISTGEMNAKIKILRKKIEISLQMTKGQGGFYPRLEKLVEQLELDTFEKSVLIYLCGSMISPMFKMAVKEDSFSKARKRTIGDLLVVFCTSVSEQVAARTYFYQSSKLVRKGLVRICSAYYGGESDLTDKELHLDRRVLDCIVGLDNESTEVARGTHLYEPKVDLTMVVLPPRLKSTIVEAVMHFDKFRAYRKSSKFDNAISYGVGLTLMFCGPSGTGKTLTANAIAAELDKKLLLVNFPTLVHDGNNEGSRFQSIFREAELSDAIIFFDECEAIFAKRQGGISELTDLLTELERFEGIVLLATNRPYDLDEAMYRRISAVFEFKHPSHLERLEIWQLVTAHDAIPFEDSIDWETIALKYELSGGFIKNAVISALMSAVGRNATSPMINEIDIVEGCKEQMRGALQMQDFNERVVPSSGLEDLVLNDRIKQELQAMINIEKARTVLFGSWGFAEDMRSLQGTTALFWGPRGCGKSRAAEAVGFELGKPLKKVDFPQLLWKSRERSVSAVREIFKEARLMDAVLVLDGQTLQTESAITSTHDEIGLLGLLVSEMTRFPGVVIVMLETTTTTTDSLLDDFISRLDKGLLNGLKFILQFDLPELASRATLWEKLIPKPLPTKGTIDFNNLAKASTGFSYVQIGNSIYRAAASAAMRKKRLQQVTMEDLQFGIEVEKKRSESTAADRYFKSQYL